MEQNIQSYNKIQIGDLFHWQIDQQGNILIERNFKR